MKVCAADRTNITALPSRQRENGDNRTSEHCSALNLLRSLTYEPEEIAT
jgi:hypothetical protein